MMKNFFMSDEAAMIFLIVFSEIATGVAAYFSGLKKTRMDSALTYLSIAFSSSLSSASSTL
jgi:hypothetical protein